MGVLSWLWGASSGEQVMMIEREEPTFEQRLQRIVATSRKLSSRSEEERQALIDDVTEALDILDGAIDILEVTELAERARRTRAKIRRIKTRTLNAA